VKSSLKFINFFTLKNLSEWENSEILDYPPIS